MSLLRTEQDSVQAWSLHMRSTGRKHPICTEYDPVCKGTVLFLYGGEKGWEAWNRRAGGQLMSSITCSPNCWCKKNKNVRFAKVKMLDIWWILHLWQWCWESKICKATDGFYFNIDPDWSCITCTWNRFMNISKGRMWQEMTNSRSKMPSNFTITFVSYE